MEINELKKSMSTLEQVLAKTNADVEIDISASKNAKSKLLKKYRNNIIIYLILAVVFTVAIAAGINELSFPTGLKIYLVALLLIASAWYVFLYLRIKKIDVATIMPASLFSKITNIKMQMISGEIFFGIAMAVFFTLLFPPAWAFNRLGFWAMSAGLAIAIVYSFLYYYPQYIKLFRDLSSIKE